MTEGESFERVCDDYLDRHDPERKEERLRERDAKANGNGSQKGKAEDKGPGRSRYVPALEKRGILRAAGGDRCQVDWCNNVRCQTPFCRQPLKCGFPVTSKMVSD